MNNKPGGLLFFGKAKLCCSLCRSVANCFQAFAPSLRSGTEIDMTKKNAPTIKDVAREAGVAVGTVSKVINGRNVREPYRQKVEDAIRKLNYEVNTYARGLKIEKSHLIALIIPNTINPFLQPLRTMWKPRFMKKDIKRSCAARTAIRTRKSLI